VGRHDLPVRNEPRQQPPDIVWDWSAATSGAIYALPGAVVVVSDRSWGLALSHHVPVLAVVAIAWLGIGSALLAGRFRLARSR
jgi:hypothetical protein